MLKIAHIINPVKVSPDSDLFIAQPITFESMRISRERALEKFNHPTNMLQASSDSSNSPFQDSLNPSLPNSETELFEKEALEIELLSVSFPEDHEIIPDYFRKLPNLTRSVADVGAFQTLRKFPLIRDILTTAYENSTADFLIYTNVDIGLYPDFYSEVVRIIGEGHDAFIINRRRIPAVYAKPEDLPEIWESPGKKHPGFDCFVFKRELVPKFELENVCVGIVFIGILTAHNLFAFGKNFKLFDKEHLTFHLGMEIFKARPGEYMDHNKREFRKAIRKLIPSLEPRKLPYYHWFWPVRLIRWGLQPSIPIKVALELEWRKLFPS